MRRRRFRRSMPRTATVRAPSEIIRDRELLSGRLEKLTQALAKLRSAEQSRNLQIETLSRDIARRQVSVVAWVAHVTGFASSTDYVANQVAAAWVQKLRSQRSKVGNRIFSSIEEGIQFLDTEVRSTRSRLNEIGSELERREALDEAAQLKARRAQAKRDRHELQQALAARARGSVRGDASRVRRELATDHSCPYCNGPLGDNPHADHIHPVSKGGLSTSANMVYACSLCNSKKRDQTLNQFLDYANFDRDAVITRLAALGKDF